MNYDAMPIHWQLGALQTWASVAIIASAIYLFATRNR